jgi:hypothetical protein
MGTTKDSRAIPAASTGPATEPLHGGRTKARNQQTLPVNAIEPGAARGTARLRFRLAGARDAGRGGVAVIGRTASGLLHWTCLAETTPSFLFSRPAMISAALGTAVYVHDDVPFLAWLFCVLFDCHRLPLH